MTTKVVPGLLIATPDPAQAAREGTQRMARAVRDAIKERGSASIALSGGSSPMEMYGLFAKETFDWSKIRIFFVDDRAVPPTSERSNYAAVKKALLDPAGVPAANVFAMKGDAADLAAAAAEYETTLRERVTQKLGGVPCLDLVVLGVGEDGHTASLFPGEPSVHVTDRLVVSVPAAGKREARLTLTTPILENARASVVVVLGAAKNGAIERIWAVNGSLDETPARIVRNFRGSITWVIDRAAGGMG